MDKKYNPAEYEIKKLDGNTDSQELLHYQDSVELIYVKEGELHCHVNQSDFLLQKGDICFINEEQLHRVYCTKDQKAELEVLSMKPSVLAASGNIYEQYVLPVIKDPDFTHIRSGFATNAARTVAHLLNEIAAVLNEKPDGYELDELGLVCMIFWRLYLVHKNENEKEPMDKDAMVQRKMTTYIYDHFHEKITLEDIAGYGGVSRSKAAQLFQKYAGTTPIAFVNQYRLENSVDLLLNTDLNIGEIAYRCGFNEQSYFNRQFSKTYGLTPVAWRRLHQA